MRTYRQVRFCIFVYNAGGVLLQSCLLTGFVFMQPLLMLMQKYKNNPQTSVIDKMTNISPLRLYQSLKKPQWRNISHFIDNTCLWIIFTFLHQHEQRLHKYQTHNTFNNAHNSHPLHLFPDTLIKLSPKSPFLREKSWPAGLLNF